MKQFKDFPLESAGRLLTTKVPQLLETATISQAREMLNENASTFSSINYIYITDKAYKLVGVVSIKQIFTELESVEMSEIMQTNVISVRSHTDQERVAMISLDKNLKAIPVVDKEGKLLGAVTSDTILLILHNEHVEDLLHRGGIRPHKFENAVNTPLSESLKHRLPWLVLGLLGGVAAAIIVESFESALQAELALAAFIPAVVYMADAVGTQVQTIFIRSQATEAKLSFWNYLAKELLVNLVLAVILGLIIFIISLSIWNSITLTIILLIAIIVTTLTAMLSGILLPLFFNKLKIDAAIASGPFATVVRDILSLTIYFLIARIITGII